MARVTSTGINFSDSTSLNSKYGIIPKNADVIFCEVSAPTGWTQVSTHNNKALRVVNTSGAGSSGNIPFTSAFTTQPISGNVPVTITGLAGNPHTLSAAEIPSHSHPVNSGGNVTVGGSAPIVGAATVPGPGTSTGNTGGNGAHGHPVTYTTANGPFSTTMDLRVSYVDVIICNFD